MRMSPTDMCVWTLGSQLVVLFGKAMEPLGCGGALLEEDRCHLGQALGFITWFHFCSLCFQTADGMCQAGFLLPHSPAMTHYISLDLQAKISPFSFLVALFAGFFLITITKKKRIQSFWPLCGRSREPESSSYGLHRSFCHKIIEPNYLPTVCVENWWKSGYV